MARRPLFSRWTAMLLSALSITLANGTAHSAGETKVVASFSILADMARQVGGDRVEVVGLVGPEGDAHEYQPTPADAKKVANAKLLVVNGLGFEGWIARLEQSSGFKGIVVTASDGIHPLLMEEGGGGRPKKVTDPHAWQSLANGRIYIRNIRDGLIGADPEGRQAYEANAAKLIAAIDELEPKVKGAIERIPADRLKIITSHDAFGYFADAYGMQFIAPLGVSTESDPSAADVARIIRQIRAQKIPAVFVENITDKRLLEQIGRETGARIGGTLYSDALSKADGPAATYLDMFRHNVETLTSALSS
jgi:zinc/manganese transport system substrate-binding protein